MENLAGKHSELGGKRPLSIYWNSAWLLGLKDTNKENWMTMFVHFFWSRYQVALESDLLENRE